MSMNIETEIKNIHDVINEVTGDVNDHEDYIKSIIRTLNTIIDLLLMINHEPYIQKDIKKLQQHIMNISIDFDRDY